MRNYLLQQYKHSGRHDGHILAAPMLITAEERVNMFGYSDEEEEEFEGFQAGDDLATWILSNIHR